MRQVCSMASAWGDKVRSLVERWHGEGLGSLTGRFLGMWRERWLLVCGDASQGWPRDLLSHPSSICTPGAGAGKRRELGREETVFAAGLGASSRERGERAPGGVGHLGRCRSPAGPSSEAEVAAGGHVSR